MGNEKFYISVYVPDMNKNREERGNFFKDVTLNEIAIKEKIFFVGNLNFRICNVPIKEEMKTQIPKLAKYY